ncbi:hypothetical protein HOLDEFILI_01663 [Holdemania filiformis DSM 12042]|uniref:Uncharacterized protein n=1 Tax=Holdemania filiformis DSM 12042 TaxID=545696 RepID=B9Y768_9FIRM|nr:hypothetical protein HOLDEFILI_01663 [Holdemania filiformis DSM 12042]
MSALRENCISSEKIRQFFSLTSTIIENTSFLVNIIMFQIYFLCNIFPLNIIFYKKTWLIQVFILLYSHFS